LYDLPPEAQPPGARHRLGVSARIFFQTIRQTGSDRLTASNGLPEERRRRKRRVRGRGREVDRGI